MRRRGALGLGAAAFLCRPARGQVRPKRLAVLALSETGLTLTRQVVLPELARQGFVEGQTLVVDEAIGPTSGLAPIAQRLVAAGPDVLIAIGGNAAVAAAAATSRVPIVSFGADLVALGLALSHSKPGRNVTGFVLLLPELDAKRLHLLIEAVPGLRRVGILRRAGSLTAESSDAATREVAAAAGFTLHRYEARGPEAYSAAFAAMRRDSMQAVVIAGDAILSRDTAALMALANSYAIPSACQWRAMAQAGCMLSYGADLEAGYRRFADYVLRIFRGATPGDLPIEQPTKFELVVNLPTARALSVTLPEAILTRADETIE
jgi:putative ABC transport system substrate-binding protein